VSLLRTTVRYALASAGIFPHSCIPNSTIVTPIALMELNVGDGPDREADLGACTVLVESCTVWEGPR
jgi:hypothetical protein